MHIALKLPILPLFVAVACVCPATSVPADPIAPEDVRTAIQRGARFLVSKQKANGDWDEITNEPGGVTSLCTLALLNSGRRPQDREIEKALRALRNTEPGGHTYATSLQIMVLCAADPKKDLYSIRRLAAQLQATQLTAGDKKGGNGAWGYNRDKKSFDKSNSQFALLALNEAERVGVEIKESTWLRALDFWKREQNADGGWSYNTQQPATGSMTCAGIASLIIAAGQVNDGDASWEDSQSQCCGRQAGNEPVQRGLDWLADHFSVRENPSMIGLPRQWYYYYMYGLERVGRLSGRRFIGSYDWYREGTASLLIQQDPLTGKWTGEAPENDVIATSLALLFLSKGRRPILISKLRREPDEDWNRHRHDVVHLTRFVERQWRQDLTWQVIDGRKATADDLLQSPVLYLSGRDSLKMTSQEKQNLRNYLLSGGFLFADACCGGKGFDAEFRELMREILPDSRLRFLEPEHPVWYAEQRVPDEYLKPLLGMDACCRTGVIYCPEDLSCMWELYRRRNYKKMSPEMRKEVKAAMAMGANILAYATNRELRDKLDPLPSQLLNADDKASPEALRAAVLHHSGGPNDAPAALGNLMQRLKAYSQHPVSARSGVITAVDPSLDEHPILFVHGRRRFEFSPAERAAIKRHIDRGGFILANSICASDAFTRAFRLEMQRIFPNEPLRTVAPEHPALTPAFRGFDLSRVDVHRPVQRADTDEPLRTRTTQESPTLEAIERDGRLVVVLSPLDMSCALENHPSLECLGYTPDSATQLGINLILYAMLR